jgi:hypothetical protein
MTRKTAKEWAKELHDGADIYRKEGRHDLAERQDEVAALLIRQEGTLIAKSSPELQTLVNALRSKVGECGALVDDQGFSWAGCTLVRVRFTGQRAVVYDRTHRVDYEAEYRQRDREDWK